MTPGEGGRYRKPAVAGRGRSVVPVVIRLHRDGRLGYVVAYRRRARAGADRHPVDGG